MRVLSRDPAQHRAQRRPRLPADEHVRPARAGSDAARQRQALPRRSPSTATWRSPSVTQTQHGRVRVSFLDRVRGGEQSVQASYVLGCDGANSPTRASIGAHMYGLPFTQDWLVIDVNTDVELNQWEGCHQLCNPERGGTYMRVGRNPLPLGIPAARRRNRSRLPDPRRRSSRWSGPGWATLPPTRWSWCG